MIVVAPSGGRRARSPLLSVARLAPALRRQPVATSFYSGRADRFFGENVLTWIGRESQRAKA
jgi:hypothetical protein